MNDSRRLLFLVSGLGLGNSSRCAAVMEVLVRKGYKIDIATSANGLEYFKSIPLAGEIFSLEPLSYGGSQGRISVLKTLAKAPGLLRSFIKNVIKLRSILRDRNYAGIVIDSDYSVIGLIFQKRPPVLAINNSAAVIQECRRLPLVPKQIRRQLRVETLDFLFHSIIPDRVICPTLFPGGSTLPPHMVRVPPILREGFEVRHRSNKVRSVLVMMSGSPFGSNLDFLEQLRHIEDIEIEVVGRSGLDRPRLRFHGKISQNQNLVSQADIMVINSGFSAVSEAYILGKPAVSIPIENHAEQYVNAALLQASGLGFTASEATVVGRVAEVIKSYPNIRLKSRHNPGAGAQYTAREIENLCFGSDLA